MLTYLNSIGYATHFNIPTELVTPQLSTVLATTVGLAMVGFVVLASLDVMSRGRQYISLSPIEWRAAIVLAGLFLAFLLVYGTGWVEVLIGNLMLVVLPAYLFFGRIWLRHRGHVREQMVKEDEAVFRSSPLLRLMSRFGVFWSLATVTLLFSAFFAVAAGNFAARTQVTFLVTDSPATDVELAIYGDTVVLAPVDLSNHRIKNEFDLVKIGSTSLHLRAVETGPLAVET